MEQASANHVSREAILSQVNRICASPGFRNSDRLCQFLRFAWGCNFIEVRIHERTREIRVPRMMGAYTARYIVNPRLARSQLIGSMIWGIGGAMLEATVLDEKRVRYVNNDLAEYEIAVNADINEIEAFLLPEENSDFNMLNTKGLGQMGNAGTAAAIANAVYHATGKRITDLPINLSKMFDDQTL